MVLFSFNNSLSDNNIISDSIIYNPEKWKDNFLVNNKNNFNTIISNYRIKTFYFKFNNLNNYITQGKIIGYCHNLNQIVYFYDTQIHNIDGEYWGNTNNLNAINDGSFCIFLKSNINNYITFYYVNNNSSSNFNDLSFTKLYPEIRVKYNNNTDNVDIYKIDNDYSSENILQSKETISVSSGDIIFYLNTYELYKKLEINFSLNYNLWQNNYILFSSRSIQENTNVEYNFPINFNIKFINNNDFIDISRGKLVGISKLSEKIEDLYFIIDENDVSYKDDLYFQQLQYNTYIWGNNNNNIPLIFFDSSLIMSFYYQDTDNLNSQPIKLEPTIKFYLNGGYLYFTEISNNTEINVDSSTDRLYYNPFTLYYPTNIGQYNWIKRVDLNNINQVWDTSHTLITLGNNNYNLTLIKTGQNLNISSIANNYQIANNLEKLTDLSIVELSNIWSISYEEIVINKLYGTYIYNMLENVIGDMSYVIGKYGPIDLSSSSSLLYIATFILSQPQDSSYVLYDYTSMNNNSKYNNINTWNISNGVNENNSNIYNMINNINNDNIFDYTSENVNIYFYLYMG